MDATTIKLAELAHGIDVANLPAVAVHEAKRRVIDSIACAVGAYDEEFCASIRAFAGRYSGQQTARIWGTGARSSVEMAGFANATAVRYLDFNDTYLSRSAGHPSDMIPGLMALVEAEGGDGPALIAGIVAAYELYCGVCNSTKLAEKGLDQALCAAIGTAGGASRLLGLSAEQTANAISLALVANIHLNNVRSGTLSDWKACAGPNAARNGIFAALLARDDVTGPTEVFEGKGGLFDLVAPFEFQHGSADARLILETHLKFHPVCYHGQSGVDAAVALSSQVALADVSEIRIETYAAAATAMGGHPSRWAPTTRETADHSLPFTVAVALSTGKLVSSDYDEERLTDSMLKDIMAKVQVANSPEYSQSYPAQSPTKITIRTTNGQEISAEQKQPKGHAMNPLTDGELETKLLNLLPPGLTGQKARHLLDLAWTLDRAESVVPLVDALVFAG